LTLNKVIKLLKGEPENLLNGTDAAYRICNIFLNSDIIYFLVGTAINPAHQNPNMPIEMGLRRISVNKIAEILKNKFLKKVEIEYV
ncbi:MAG: stage II sporulation protein E, partial [Bacteroidales bacterium]|nr:stage II sporulation protein E [Bacteroidales bacterium]